CDCEDESEDRREDAHPTAPRLQSKPEEGAEHASQHCMATKPEKRVPGAKLQSVGGDSVFRVTLSHIQCGLEPIESCADKGPINDPITHTVMLGVQNPEDYDHAECLYEFLRDRCGNRSCKQHRGIRPQKPDEIWSLRNPLVDQAKESGVEDEGERRSNT